MVAQGRLPGMERLDSRGGPPDESGARSAALPWEVTGGESEATQRAGKRLCRRPNPVYNPPRFKHRSQEYPSEQLLALCPSRLSKLIFSFGNFCIRNLIPQFEKDIRRCVYFLTIQIHWSMLCIPKSSAISNK